VTDAVNGKDTRRVSNDNVIAAINAIVKEHIHKRVHGPTFRGSIINLSLEGPVDSPAFQRTVKKAFNAGIVLVAGAGNSKVSASGAFPCAYDEVICVGSGKALHGLPAARYYTNRAVVDSSYRFSSAFSNYGPSVDILAPGELIFSPSVGCAVPNECVEFASGTSIATPFISGIIGK
jgi:serine protease